MAAKPSTVTFETTSTGLARLVVANQAARATLYLQGAHLTSYQPSGHANLLWVSSAEDYQPGKAIRGGIPVCWPWFGAHPEKADAPSHGLVRTELWDWEVVREHEQLTQLALSYHTDGNHPAFPFRTRLILAVSIGAALEACGAELCVN